MRFFNAVKNVAYTAYFVGMPAVAIGHEIKQCNEIDKMIKEYPKARYTCDERMIRGQYFPYNHRMIDTETNEVVARMR